MSTDPSRFSAEPPKPQKGWFARNWIWVLIVVVVGAVASFCLCCGGGAWFFGSQLMKAEPFVVALGTAVQSDEVKEQLGEPIELAGMPSNININETGDAGSASIDFNIKGPKGSAHVHTEATRAAGKWTTTVLKVTFSDGSSVDLAPAEKP